jgi:hypothetical protein
VLTPSPLFGARQERYRIVVVVEVPATVVVVLIGIELGIEVVVVDPVVDVLVVVLVEGGTVTVVVVRTGVDVVGIGATVVGGLTVSPRGPM